MLFFGTLRLLTSFLGPSWRFLARFDPKIAPEMTQIGIKDQESNGPKLGKLVYSIFNSCWANFEVQKPTGFLASGLLETQEGSKTA